MVFPISNMPARPSAGIGVVEVQKPMAFCARPSAGIGLVEVQKPMVFFCDFCGARATLCRDRRGRGAKTHGFFLRFLRCSRNPLRESAWARCKNSRVFATCCSNWSSGVVSWFARLLPEPAGRGFDSSLVRGRARKMQLAFFKATCAEQLAQCNLRRATCADQLAPTSLRRAPCLVLSRANLHTLQLAQSNLRKATCACARPGLNKFAAHRGELCFQATHPVGV